MPDGGTRTVPPLADRVQSLLRRRDDALALAAGLKARIKEMEYRAQRLANTAESLSEQIAATMRAEGAGSIRLPEATLSLKEAAPKVKITDPDALPPSYWRVKPGKQEIDRKAILDDLKQGVIVDGAELESGGTLLQIRKD